MVKLTSYVQIKQNTTFSHLKVKHFSLPEEISKSHDSSIRLPGSLILTFISSPTERTLHESNEEGVL